jgi:hypothetical protein
MGPHFSGVHRRPDIHSGEDPTNVYRVMRGLVLTLLIILVGLAISFIFWNLGYDHAAQR